MDTLLIAVGRTLLFLSAIVAGVGMLVVMGRAYEVVFNQRPVSNRFDRFVYRLGAVKVQVMGILVAAVYVILLGRWAYLLSTWGWLG